MNKQVNFNVARHILCWAEKLKSADLFNGNEFIMKMLINELGYQERTLKLSFKELQKLELIRVDGKYLCLTPKFFRIIYGQTTPEKVYKYKLQLAKAELKRNIGE